MRYSSQLLIAVSLSGLLFPALNAQTGELNAPAIIREFAKRCKEARRYSWEGDLALDLQRGAAPVQRVAEGRIRLASGEGGKHYVEVRAADLEPYVLICDGTKNWAYVPGKKQYTEEEATSVSGNESEEEGEGESDDERPITEKFARLLVPILSELALKLEAADQHGIGEAKYEGKKVKWPILRALSAKDAQGGRSLTELTLDPATFSLARVAQNTASYTGDQKRIVRLTVDLKTFRLGDVPDSVFDFGPPKNVRLVEDLAIPGQTGSVFLNKPAPDFELKTLDGEKIGLNDLKGKPVLLSFWASWCGPCRRELPGLDQLHAKFKDQGLVILGINDEEKGDARRYVEKAGLRFPTLHDGSKKVHRLYRVRSIPTVFLLDKDGKVVRFFRGSRDEAALRAALSAVGL